MIWIGESRFINKKIRKGEKQMGLADDHGSGYHPMLISDKGHDGGAWSGMWIFAIVIIFFALILIWRKDGGERRNDGNYSDAITPALTMAAMNQNACRPQCDGYDGHKNEYQHWDIARDELREFGEVKKEIAVTALGQSREMDKYFYEQRAAIDRNNYDTLLGFKNSEILGLQNTKEVVGRIDGLERRMDQDVIRKQGEELNYYKTVAALSPKPPMPAYFPRYDVPVQQNVYACEPGCYPGQC